MIHLQAQPFNISGSSDLAILFIHGFTASPSEMYPLANRLQTRLDCTVRGVLLPGHGSSPQDLNQTSWLDWYEQARTELNDLLQRYNHVYVVGLSMGGLLAVYTGLHIPGLKGVVSINAPMFNRFRWITALAPVLQWACPYFPKGNRARSEQLELMGRYAYKVYPLRALQSMLDLRRKVMEELPGLTVPMLVVQSQDDESVDPRSAVWLAEHAHKIQAEIMELRKSGHVATMGPEMEALADKISDFVIRFNQGGN